LKHLDHLTRRSGRSYARREKRYLPPEVLIAVGAAISSTFLTGGTIISVLTGNGNIIHTHQIIWNTAASAANEAASKAGDMHGLVDRNALDKKQAHLATLHTIMGEGNRAQRFLMDRLQPGGVPGLDDSYLAEMGKVISDIRNDYYGGLDHVER
jgi:hypothetical protein